MDGRHQFIQDPPMFAPGASPLAGFMGLLLALLPSDEIPLAPDPLQEEPRPKVSADDPGLKQRRDRLLKLEEWVQFRHDELKLQLTDFVAAQREVTLKAWKDYQDAKRAREIAQYAVKEYVQGIYLLDSATALGKIVLAKTNLECAIDRLKALEGKRDGGARVDPNELMVAKLDFEQASFDEEQAITELKFLNEFTKEKETKRLEAAVAVAQVLEAEKKGLMEMSQAREAKLIEQAERFKIRSPEDLVISLIDDAIQSETKAIAVVAEARKLEEQIRQNPGDVASITTHLKARKEEAGALMDQAKAQLLEASQVGEKVKAIRTQLRDAEAMLKKERDLVDRMERAAASRP
jgi:hypothetical protein